MQTGFSIAVIVAVAATFVVLIVGVVAMLRQGKFNAEYSNKLMRLRVIFQFTAIMLILFAFLISHK
jgi:ABC-type dipeptide/oligopeptide/nickel transport system permease subunit